MSRINLSKWTPELAYAVGLITTDGSLSKDKRHIDLTSSEPQLLNTFKKCLKLQNKICVKYNSHNPDRKYYHLQFGNVKFFGWLLKLGLMPNKTSKLNKLSIPGTYFRDFLRGHLDGDGSIFTYIDRYMSYKESQYEYKRLYTVFNSASCNHIKWIRDNLINILGIKGSLACDLRKNRKIPAWKLKFAKNESLRILQWIYYKENLPCLMRKRVIAEEFIRNDLRHTRHFLS